MLLVYELTVNVKVALLDCDDKSGCVVVACLNCVMCNMLSR